MVLIDFHKHAQRRATNSQSSVVSKAGMCLAISIRRTTLSFEFKHPADDFNDASKVNSSVLVTQG
jgi:hypothetical protein